LKFFGVFGTPLQSLLYPREVNAVVTEGEYPVKKNGLWKKALGVKQ
jgi:hypothetical protein